MAGNAVSLYFRLEDGHSADLEIIAEAAIAWVETLRAAAQAVFPESDVKVELVNVDQSSAIFNTLVDWFDRNADQIARGYERQPRGRKLVLALSVFTITAAYPTYDVIFGDDFTAEDRLMLKRIEEQTRNNPAVRTARGKFYRIVERERVIQAVGIKEKPTSDPIVLKDSKSFEHDDGLFTVETDIPERVTQSVHEVVLVKPALVHTPRSWTFKPDGLPEFDAVMRDGKVLNAIQTRGFPEQMREGIRMTIRIETREVLVEGQWKLVRGGRSVMRVIDPKID